MFVSLNTKIIITMNKKTYKSRYDFPIAGLGLRVPTKKGNSRIKKPRTPKPQLIKFYRTSKLEKKGNSIGVFRPKQIIFPSSTLNKLLYKKGALKIRYSNPINKNNTNMIRIRRPMPTNFTAYDFNNTIDEGLSTRKGIQKTITSKMPVGTNPGFDFIPVKVENSSGKGPSLTNVDGNRIIHKTAYETGFRPSKALLTLARQHGVEHKVVADSKISLVTSATRNALTAGSGFNMTQLYVPMPLAQLTNRQMRDACWGGLGPSIEPSVGKSERLAVLNVKQQYMIKNQSSNFAIDFTIHLVRLNTQNFSPPNLNIAMNNCFYGGNLTTDTPANVGRVPRFYQRAPFITDLSGNLSSSSVDVSNKLRSLPRYIPNFKNQFTIVESFTKTVAPGEYWNFSHTHNCGGGIDASQLSAYSNGGTGNLAFGLNQSGDDLPFTLGVIFSAKGKMCEAFTLVDASNIDTYLGTSPTFYMFEYKHTANIVRNQNSALAGSLPYIISSESQENPNPTGTTEPNLPALRERAFPRSDFRDAPQPLTGTIGTYWIPFNSTAVPSFAGITGNPDPG